MSVWFLALVSAIYAVASVSLLVEGKIGLSLFAAGCVIANIGLMMSARG